MREHIFKLDGLKKIRSIDNTNKDSNNASQCEDLIGLSHSKFTRRIGLKI